MATAGAEPSGSNYTIGNGLGKPVGGNPIPAHDPDCLDSSGRLAHSRAVIGGGSG